MVGNITLVLIALGSDFFFIWLVRRISSRRRFAGLPRVGINPGILGLRTQAAKDEFFAKGQQLLEQGYAKVGFLLRALVMDIVKNRCFFSILTWGIPYSTKTHHT